MIIWINGAFGSGKTQTAYELHRRVTDSFIYDPENAGFFIRKNIPRKLICGDFQDYHLWRNFNYSMLKYITSEYKGVIIVPMTIRNPQYFSEIVGNLRGDGLEIRHFVLSASKETLIKRLRSRGEGKKSWAAGQIDKCIEGFSNEVFNQHIKTDGLSIEEVVEEIASLVDIKLLPDNRGKFRKVYDRFVVKIKNIRI
ncbi:MAG: AAA family ATPase [Clostridiaceae bacterium]